MKSMNVIAFFAALVLCASLANADEPHCLQHEVLNKCGTMCPKTCLNRDLQINCVKMCKVNACECEHGFMRLGVDARGGNGECIAETTCDEAIRKMVRH